MILLKLHINDYLGKELENEKQFEQEFHEIFDNKDDEMRAAKILTDRETEINHQNELFSEGKAHFKESKYLCMYI